MKNEVQQDTKLRRYLLGELTLEEQVLIEQRLFLDSDYAELEQAVEDDLIDEYLHDDLAAGEGEKFERHFLRQPERREDLRIAEALKKYLSSEGVAHLGVGPDVPRSTANGDQPGTVLPFPFLTKPVIWWALAATALIILSVIAWKGIPSLRGLTGDQPLQAGEPQPAKSQPQERQQPGPVGPDNHNTQETSQKQDNINQNADKAVKRQLRGTQFATFIIKPGGKPRSVVDGNSVTVTDQLQGVVLRLPLTLTGPYDKYRVELLSDGRTIDTWEVSTTKTDKVYGTVVSVTVPVRLLREQSYKLNLRGVTGQQSSPPTTYWFDVNKK